MISKKTKSSLFILTFFLLAFLPTNSSAIQDQEAPISIKDDQFVLINLNSAFIVPKNIISRVHWSLSNSQEAAVRINAIDLTAEEIEDPVICQITSNRRPSQEELNSAYLNQVGQKIDKHVTSLNFKCRSADEVPFATIITKYPNLKELHLFDLNTQWSNEAIIALINFAKNPPYITIKLLPAALQTLKIYCKLHNNDLRVKNILA